MKTYRTILTRKAQANFLSNYARLARLEHNWSARGYGRSTFKDARGEKLGEAKGCGYDRRGAAFGQAVATLFPEQLRKLALRECEESAERPSYCGSDRFYGLFMDRTTGRVWVDGGCGFSSMERILNAIGFQLTYVGGDKGSKTAGSEYYVLEPAARDRLKWIAR